MVLLWLAHRVSLQSPGKGLQVKLVDGVHLPVAVIAPQYIEAVLQLVDTCPKEPALPCSYRQLRPCGPLQGLQGENLSGVPWCPTALAASDHDVVARPAADMPIPVASKTDSKTKTCQALILLVRVRKNEIWGSVNNGFYS